METATNKQAAKAPAINAGPKDIASKDPKQSNETECFTPSGIIPRTPPKTRQSKIPDAPSKLTTTKTTSTQAAKALNMQITEGVDIRSKPTSETNLSETPSKQTPRALSPLDTKDDEEEWNEMPTQANIAKPDTGIVGILIEAKTKLGEQRTSGSSLNIKNEVTKLLDLAIQETLALINQ